MQLQGMTTTSSGPPCQGRRRMLSAKEKNRVLQDKANQNTRYSRRKMSKNVAERVFNHQNCPLFRKTAVQPKQKARCLQKSSLFKNKYVDLKVEAQLCASQAMYLFVFLYLLQPKEPKALPKKSTDENLQHFGNEKHPL